MNARGDSGSINQYRAAQSFGDRSPRIREENEAYDLAGEEPCSFEDNSSELEEDIPAKESKHVSGTQNSDICLWEIMKERIKNSSNTNANC